MSTNPKSCPQADYKKTASNSNPFGWARPSTYTQYDYSNAKQNAFVYKPRTAEQSIASAIIRFDKLAATKNRVNQDLRESQLEFAISLSNNLRISLKGLPGHLSEILKKILAFITKKVKATKVQTNNFLNKLYSKASNVWPDLSIQTA
jgi:hypothetical protein